MKKKTRKYIKKKRREEQVDDGFFDGRFNQRVEKSKKDYSRKVKHKGKDYE